MSGGLRGSRSRIRFEWVRGGGGGDGNGKVWLLVVSCADVDDAKRAFTK